MNCWWGGSSHLVKNASVLSISSCLFSPPHAPIALPSLPPPPTRHILDIFTPFYLHNCLHYPVRKGMSECRGGGPSLLCPQHHDSVYCSLLPLTMQTKSDLSLHWMATKTEDNRHLIKELLAPSVSFRCNSAHCFGELFKKSELAFVDIIASHQWSHLKMSQKLWYCEFLVHY